MNVIIDIYFTDIENHRDSKKISIWNEHERRDKEINSEGSSK